MNTQEFFKELKETFPEFNFHISKFADENISKSIFGIAKVTPTSFRENKTKALVIASPIRKMFISSIMYENTKPIEEQFIYAIVYTLAKIRNYRCKSFHPLEHEKVFESAKNYELLLESLKAQKRMII